MKRWLILAVCMVLIGVACGKPQEYGGGLDPNKIPDATPTCRLGECKSAVPSPEPTEKLVIGAPSPTVKVEATRPPEEKFFDVYLVEESPFYAFGPNRELGQDFTMPSSFTLRVTNQDRTDGRPIRSFTAQGAFDSGPMKPGATWTQKFGQPGSWDITDRAAGFIRAKLTVEG